MRLATIKIDEVEQAAIVFNNSVVPISDINQKCHMNWATTVYQLLVDEQWHALNEWFQGLTLANLQQLNSIPIEEIQYAPLYRHPRKICGVGMNYWKKAEDLGAIPPVEEPIVFLKPDTCLIGHQQNIIIPAKSNEVTAEAELGIIIGKTCKNISELEAMSVIAGLVPTLDMTDQSIHAKNPRFLGRSKVMDTFFSYGPQIVTMDEINSLERLNIVTILNGEPVHHNTVSNMIYKVPFIVSYFSKMMTLLPGDIIMTGTPGSVHIQAGDVAACYITGMEELINPVVSE